MNISTGGPHILLFERDQQLATLLVSELQLAGYTNHTARTAVEVFDTIARYPIRLVLVNLAQAAAARREFWVALDSQRRDRKVQVLTFLCTNLASYGPRDFEDRSSSTMADIEVDGMMGLMSLVDAIRTRVPDETIETNTNTLPRLPKIPTTPPSSMAARPQQPPLSGQGPGGATLSYRSTNSSDMDNQPAATRTYMTTPLSPTTTNSFASQAQSTTPTANTTTNNNGNATISYNEYAAQNAPNTPTPTYTEKIRAVLYPNQRTWSAQGTNSYSQESKDIPAPYAQRSYNANPAGPSDSALQRLAAGQASDNVNESGLAQLSRMARGYRSPLREENDTSNNNNISSYTTTTEPMAQPAPTRTPAANTTYPLIETAQPSGPRSTPSAITSLPQMETTEIPQMETNGQSSSNTAYIPPSARPIQTNENTSPQTNISTQTLRASPIQDMPIERTVTGPTITDNTRRPDVLSRADYGQQLAQIAQQLQDMQQMETTSPPLASITTPMPSIKSTPASKVASTTSASEKAVQKANEEVMKEQEIGELIENGKENRNRSEVKQDPAESKPGIDFEEGLTANNAVLLDIVQSLPPMPALSEQPQSVQPQVLSGRATRSLGKVLLDGHLVPHDRLEVAQNIQRMLRGVDLNYQLGEILLMFKLLTPDQLLAASLVSYGLITTTQISALGRIRQELHSIGLEYDLENLLILFRILTPEQLREVRASLQS
jgi:hypothetical protein